jgi:hypothetical protein
MARHGHRLKQSRSQSRDCHVNIAPIRAMPDRNALFSFTF